MIKCYGHQEKIILSYLNCSFKKKIDFQQFEMQFYNLNLANSEKYEILTENLKAEASSNLSKSNEIIVNSESSGFSSIISNLEQCLELYDSRVTLEMNLKSSDIVSSGISADYLRILVEESFFPKIQKYCKES